MKLTLSLKEWAQKNLSVAKDATDETYRKELSTAIASGKLSVDELGTLSKEPAPAGAKGLDVLKSLLAEQLGPVNDRLKALETAGVGAGAAGATGAGGTTPPNTEKGATGTGEQGLDLVMKALSQGAADGFVKAFGGMRMGGNAPQSAPTGLDDKVTPVKLFSGEDSLPDNDVRIRVKSAAERYDTTNKGAYYPENYTKHYGFAGTRMKDAENGRDLNLPSQLDRAVAGAYWKYSVNLALKQFGGGIPPQFRMTDHDKGLMLHAVHNMEWKGLLNFDERSGLGKHELHGQKLSDFQIKALLDDTLSGGLEAAPIVFDDQVIITPLLNGELFPKVTLVNIPRGRRIEGFSMGNPTITDGYSEGTEVPIFDTSGFIAAFDTNIYDAVGSIELGMNFEEDSPVAIGDKVIERYGEQFMTYLDKVVAIGNGTTQPEGIFNASGATDVNSANSTSGPPALSDYEGLLFGLKKEYKPKTDRGRCCYVSNEVTYRRSRAMKVNPATPSTDERRLLGMDHESYQTLEYDHKIQHDIPNGKLAFVNFRYYRMYRRLGMQIRIETGGKELARRNQRLIVLRARFGGQMELGGALATMDDAQS
jgi:HK97 family phage major capsid protein